MLNWNSNLTTFSKIPGAVATGVAVLTWVVSEKKRRWKIWQKIDAILGSLGNLNTGFSVFVH